MHRVVCGRAALHALAATAGLALLLGAAVYLVDRPAGSAWLVPAAWQAATPGRGFGSIGQWLPSLVHAFAFSVWTAWLLPRRAGFAASACLGWAVVDSLAEIGQHAAVSAPLAAVLAAAFDGAPLAMRLARYFTLGTFDPADLAAGLAGSALAYLALRRLVLPDTAARTGHEIGRPQSSSSNRRSTPPVDTPT
jgi:hypothetical protein